MPYKPKKPCSYPGCPNLTDSQYCLEHKAYERANIYRSGSRNPFYTSKEWRRTREEFLNEHPFCVMCGRPKEIVDHIIPIEHGGATLNWNNLQPLCWGCHTRKSIKEGSRFGRKEYSY